MEMVVPVMDVNAPLERLHRVYCAGPLFNDAERREMCRLAEALRGHGFDTFLPHADGMEFTPVRKCLIERGHSPEAAGRLTHRAVFALDCYQVVLGCGSLVANLNGRVPDEGAVAEATMAWMLGKPVVLYKEDVRSLIAGRDNPLVVGQTGFETVAQLERLGEVLGQQIARRTADPEPLVACPPHLRPTLAAGEALWKRITSPGKTGVPSPASPDVVAQAVLDLFAADG